jgi:hypothetical protein
MDASDALRLVVEHLADEVTYGPDAIHAATVAAAQRGDVVAGLEVLSGEGSATCHVP